MVDPQPLAPRRRPEGPRARKTVERILEAAAELLDEVGFDALTTNHIAERAQVNVASLYKYFPNKYAVLVGLAERMRDEQVAILEAQGGFDERWREALGELLDTFLELFASRPGFAELAKVLASCPPLREIDEASHAAEAGVIASRLRRLGVAGRRPDHEAIARVALEAARGVLPLASRAAPARRKRLMRELHRMLERYIASHIEG